MKEALNIRNPDGIWINSSVFTEEAKHFTKYGYYCGASPDSLEYNDYWTEQYKRWKEGYTVGGVHITGHFYKYLNFSQIMRTFGTQDKDLGFPAFYDGDYDYFHTLNIAQYGCTKEQLINLRLENNPLQIDGQHHLVVGKARRKGFSYKNAAVATNVYDTIRNSITLLAAYESKFLYPAGTMAMVKRNLSFIAQHTAFGKSREFIDRIDHIKASFKEEERGVIVEKGYMSEIICVTFQNNPDAAKGKDGKLVFFEEAGVFNNLKAAFGATKSTLEDGMFTTGLAVVFGTGGDMGSGSKDFSDMFYSPEQYNCLSFENVWDSEAEGTSCSFFVPQWKNKVGFNDKQGNTQKDKALEFDNKERLKIVNSPNSNTTLVSHAQENPNSPEEAFVIKDSNDFPIKELNTRLAKLKRDSLYTKLCQSVSLQKVEGVVKIVVDLEAKLKPLWFHKDKGEGSVVIYEAPIKGERNSYAIGYDPYRQDVGTSNAAIYIYRKSGKLSKRPPKIVASFIGRPKTFDTCNYIALMLSELYDSDIMYENEVPEVAAYFANKNKLSYLAVQPDAVIDKISGGKSKVKRKFGMHMNDRNKDAGEKYIKKWLLTVINYDEQGNEITVLDELEDIGLIEELIKYRRKGNFDRVMALMQIMFQLDEEDESNKTEDEQEQDFINDLLNRMSNG